LFFTTEDYYSAKRLTFSKDGKTLAGVIGDSVMFWDIPEGNEIGGFEVSRCGDNTLVCQIKYSPDGIHVAITYPAEISFEIWDTRDKTNARLEYEYTDPERFYVQSLSYTPDGKIAAIVSERQGDGIAITFFDVEARKIVKRFTLFEDLDSRDHVSFSPDGTLYSIITCNQIEIRRVADHSIITTVLRLWDDTPFEYFDCMLHAQITPDNQSVYYGWDGGGLVKWKLP
jgi:WD40 repeat protein